MLYEVFDENVFDEIFGTSTYYPVLQQALFHCAARTDIQNFFLAWAPSNMGVLRTVVGDAYLMYLVYNAYPSFFTSQVMDNFGVEEFYRAFERMANFNISDLMALLQNSMDPGRYDDFAASVPSFLSYEEKISLSEHYIYGSQRLGAKKATKQLQSHTLQYESGNWLPQEVNYMAEPVPAYVPKAGGLVDVGYGLGTWLSNGKLKYPQEATYTRKLGYKEYELTKHASTTLSASLGNVQATILDRRLGVKANPSDTIFSYVEADVKTAQDYYPFGMMMPGRNYSTSNLPLYRYGFNGYEKENEVYGKGNFYDFGNRMYDSRVSRFLSVDPIAGSMPETSPYSFANNSPVLLIDVDGLKGTNPNNNGRARATPQLSNASLPPKGMSHNSLYNPRKEYAPPIIRLFEPSIAPGGSTRTDPMITNGNFRGQAATSGTEIVGAIVERQKKWRTFDRNGQRTYINEESVSIQFKTHEGQLQFERLESAYWNNVNQAISNIPRPGAPETFESTDAYNTAMAGYRFQVARTKAQFGPSPREQLIQQTIDNPERQAEVTTTSEIIPEIRPSGAR